MGAIERMNVDVPASVADSLRANVRSGRYANEGEAITDAVQRAEADNRAAESWLHDVIVPICASVEAGAATLLTLEEARARLKTGR